MLCSEVGLAQASGSFDSVALSAKFLPPWIQLVKTASSSTLMPFQVMTASSVAAAALIATQADFLCGSPLHL